MPGVCSILLLAGCLARASENVTIAWDYPLTNTNNLNGFRVFYGFTSGFYVVTNDVGKLTTTLISNLIPAETYYFAVKGYYTNGVETEPSAELTYRVPVTSTNDLPALKAVRIESNENQPALLPWSQIQTNVPGGSYLIATPPAHGRITGAIPQILYSPDADYNGQDYFTLIVFDGSPTVTKVEVEVVLAPVNSPPRGYDRAVSTVAGLGLNVQLEGSDPEGSVLEYILVTPPRHGTLVGASAERRYLPAPGFVGEDSFSYQVSDGALASASATVRINVVNLETVPLLGEIAQSANEDVPAVFLLASTSGQYWIGWDAEILDLPLHGTVSLAPPVVTYVPDTNYTGTDTATFLIRQSNPELGRAAVRFTVLPVNDAPTANGFSVQTREDTPVPISLQAQDVDGDLLTYEVLSGPSHGTLSGSGVLMTYRPATNYYGSDYFTFRANDGAAVSSEVTVIIGVTPENDAPVGLPQTVATAEDTPLPITLLAHDEEGDAVTYQVVAGPAHGVLSGQGQQLSYLPATNYHGPDQFTFRASDGLGTSPAVTVTINVVSDSPVAFARAMTTREDTALPITLSGQGGSGNPLTLQLVTVPTHGVLSGTVPNVIYLPTTNYNGPDQFSYRVSDGLAVSPEVTVTIEVTRLNDAPVAVGQSVATPEDTALLIRLAGVDVDGSSVTYAVLTGPGNGVLSSVNTNTGAVTYTPNPDFNGSDAFTFAVFDGQLYATGLVSITVTPVNDSPVAMAQPVVTPEDTPLVITLAGLDADGDPLTYEVVAGPVGSVEKGPGSQVIYVPAPNFYGIDQLKFRARDGQAVSSEVTLKINVTPVNDAPVALIEAVSTPEDTALPITLWSYDVEHDRLTYALLVGPTNGTLGILNAINGSVTYTPPPNYSGPDSLTFTVFDGQFYTTGHVSITVTAQNDPPVAFAQTVTTPEDTRLPVTLLATDLDGDFLSYQIVVRPSHGVVFGTGLQKTYVPATNYSGPDQFTFRAYDGHAVSPEAQVTINVTPVNDAPVALAQAVTLQEDTTRQITLAGQDADGDSLTYELVAGPAHGQLTGVPPQVNYRPATNYSGLDELTFRVSDGVAWSQTATVTISVSSVNDAPVAVGQAVVTIEDTALPITLLGQDGDGDTLIYQVVAGPAHGALSGTGPQVIYVPATNYNGPDQFIFRVTDGVEASSEAIVTITVTPVNDAPIFLNQQVATPEETALAITLRGVDPEGDTVTYSILSGPAHGALGALNPITGAVVYTPVRDYNGPDSFTFSAFEGRLSATGLVTIIVTPVNDSPTALAQTIATPEDTALPITLAGQDVDGDTLSYEVLAGPANGTLSGIGSHRIYVPATNFYGTDQLKFRVSDGEATSPETTVTINVTPVNDPPVAVAQTVTTVEDTSLSITLAGYDVENNPLTFALLAAPAHGALDTFSTNTGALTYTPAPNYHGPDAFTFAVFDGQLYATGLVSVTVMSLNDAPVAFPQWLATPEETALPITLAAEARHRERGGSAGNLRSRYELLRVGLFYVPSLRRLGPLLGGNGDDQRDASQ